jgi:ABC-type branched-subunit amino acid transport system ATPase component
MSVSRREPSGFLDSGKAAVRVGGLVKSYRDVIALAGIDFDIGRGRDFFALLGPNGAGKTTAVEILEGFRPVMRARLPSWVMTQEPAGGAETSDRDRASLDRG